MRFCHPVIRSPCQVYLALPSLIGVIDNCGIEFLHPRREGRSKAQIDKKGKSNSHPTNLEVIVFLKRVFQLISLALLIVLTVSCTVPALSLPQTTPPPPPPATPTPAEFRPWVQGEITSPALADNLIGDPATKKYMVYLPPSYPEGEKRYPVIYALHHFVGDESTLLGLGFELDKMIARGDIPEMIVVFPDGTNRFIGSRFLNSPTIGDYETYIAHDIVSYIDANYRTLPHGDSRGITGCGMGGDASVKLAMTYPDVFSVAAGISGIYDFEKDPIWERGRKVFREAPSDISQIAELPWQVLYVMAGAAGAASNADNPPLYFDMPFEIANGEAQIVPEVAEKLNAADTVHMTPNYLGQPIRLKALMIYHGKWDGEYPVAIVQSFSAFLTEQGVEHEYVEGSGGFCDLPYEPVIQFMADHLDF